jgi:hypothetical protein
VIPSPARRRRSGPAACGSRAYYLLPHHHQLRDGRDPGARLDRSIDHTRGRGRGSLLRGGVTELRACQPSSRLADMPLPSFFIRISRLYLVNPKEKEKEKSIHGREDLYQIKKHHHTSHHSLLHFHVAKWILPKCPTIILSTVST